MTFSRPQNLDQQLRSRMGEGTPSAVDPNSHQFTRFGTTSQGNTHTNANQADQKGISNLVNQQYVPTSQPRMGFNPGVPFNSDLPVVETVHHENILSQQYVSSQPPIPMGFNPSVPFNNGFPMVETVNESDDLVAVPPSLAPPQYRPTPTEGAGVDARTAPDPRVTAERQASTLNGAPGAAQGRAALLQQALTCQLCEFLVDQVLENPNLLQVRDPASVKVHAIELLKLLTKDPGYGPKFKILLDSLPAWQKYKSQDHSLLITGHEQKADYFLTDGGSSGKDTKLLTEG